MTSTAKSHEQNEGTMYRVVKFISKFGKMVFLSIIKKKQYIWLCKNKRFFSGTIDQGKFSLNRIIKKLVLTY